MRLIDADALKKTTAFINGAMYKVVTAKDIEEAPIVEVVRCKDCKHRIHDEERCLYYCEMYYGQGDVSDDNFCQWGAKE